MYACHHIDLKFEVGLVVRLRLVCVCVRVRMRMWCACVYACAPACFTHKRQRCGHWYIQLVRVHDVIHISGNDSCDVTCVSPTCHDTFYYACGCHSSFLSELLCFTTVG